MRYDGPAPPAAAASLWRGATLAGGALGILIVAAASMARLRPASPAALAMALKSEATATRTRRRHELGGVRPAWQGPAGGTMGSNTAASFHVTSAAGRYSLPRAAFSAPLFAASTLITPQVNPVSLFRCDRST